MLSTSTGTVQGIVVLLIRMAGSTGASMEDAVDTGNEKVLCSMFGAFRSSL